MAPKTPKRPRDVNQLAKMIADIATGDLADTALHEDPISVAAAELGRKGGRARASKLTPEQRSEAARKAVMVRWAKKK